LNIWRNKGNYYHHPEQDVKLLVNKFIKFIERRKMKNATKTQDNFKLRFQIALVNEELEKFNKYQDMNPLNDMTFEQYLTNGGSKKFNKYIK
jgi:hypothetical protein